MNKLKVKPGDFGPYYDDNGKMLGHMLYPKIQKGAWKVGTMTKLKMDYTDGPVKWKHDFCLILSEKDKNGK